MSVGASRARVRHRRLRELAAATVRSASEPQHRTTNPPAGGGARPLKPQGQGRTAQCRVLLHRRRVAGVPAIAGF